MTPEQRHVYDTVVAGPRGAVVGPLLAALHRPELADRWQQLGEILRYRTSLPPHLSELAILVTARACDCRFEWYMHERVARDAGLDADVIEAIRDDRPLAHADPSVQIVWQFARALHITKFVPQPVYDEALRVLAVVGVVELTALVGYYTMVAMTLNAHEYALPEGAADPFPERRSSESAFII